MNKTIITIIFNTSEHENKWWPKAFREVCDSKKWNPIITKDLFIISSDAGSICLTPHFYETVLSCDLKEWESIYKEEVMKIIRSVDSGVTISERQENITL